MKRLVFCFDGTWNAVDASFPTNVVITAQSINPRSRDGIDQQIFYHQGVGTKKIDHLAGGIFGIGLLANIADAYRNLIFNHNPGDEIYVFGFSRGAFSARSFVGLISSVGILNRADAGKFAEAFDRYKARKQDAEYHSAMLRFRSEYSGSVCVSDDDERWRMQNCEGYVASSARKINIAYLGVWDTVGALGIPARYRFLKSFNKRLQFHDTRLTPLVRSARHAIAIDERRADFAPTLWGNVDEMNAARGTASAAFDAPYQEKWFPGVHTSVGGGGERRGLADEALSWVIDGARSSGLDLDTSDRTPIYKALPNFREYIESSPAPGFMYRMMNRIGPKDRMPGPKTLNEVSMSARRRWKEPANTLKDGKLYRPATLSSIAGALDNLRDEDVGKGSMLPRPGTYRLYQVKQGDALRKIALHELGVADRDNEIYGMNRDKLDNPNRIYPGQVLRLPV